MNVPLWVSEAAVAFWEAAGGPEPFPRRLRDPILNCPFDLSVREVPSLTVRAMERYLSAWGTTWACGEPDRPLRACLAAVDGAGVVCLDARDPPDERTFSLAHELAHFLEHYWEPRRRACRRLGQGTADVLDGKRPPTPGERVRALLANVPLGLHTHLMPRGPFGAPTTPEAARAEEEADRLAYELLAPAEAVFARDPAASPDVLGTVFGLPQAQAETYAALLAPPARVDPLLRRLRLSR